MVEGQVEAPEGLPRFLRARSCQAVLRQPVTKLADALHYLRVSIDVHVGCWLTRL